MSVAAAGVRHPRLDGFAASAVTALCLCWGLNQVAVKVANGGLQPVFQAGMRSLLAGALVVLWCRLRGIDLFHRDGTLVPGVIAGVLFATEFILVYVAFDYTTVSRGIVFLYTAPFFVALGAHLFIPGERLTGIRALGLVLAFGGVVVTFADRLSLPSPAALIGDVMCLVAAVAWAATTLVIKTTRLNMASAEKVLVYQLAVSALIMLLLAPFFGPFVRLFDGLVAAAFLYQVVIVVAVSYIVWFWLLARYPASDLSSFTFLTPVFAVLFGGVLLGEPWSPWLLLALALVALGILLVSRRRAA